MVARSSTNSVLAFFWSPDSEHIAYVAPVSSPGSFSAKPYNAPVLQETAGLAWTVLDIEDSESRTYGSFFPTEEMIYLLTFFDQFAQSHRIWSPDSRHLVYSEVTPENEAVISLIDATQAVSVPLIIAEGVIGVWSFG
jgi:TolB protein